MLPDSPQQHRTVVNHADDEPQRCDRRMNGQRIAAARQQQNKVILFVGICSAALLISHLSTANGQDDGRLGEAHLPSYNLRQLVSFVEGWKFCKGFPVFEEQFDALLSTVSRGIIQREAHIAVSVFTCSIPLNGDSMAGVIFHCRKKKKLGFLKLGSHQT